MNLFESLESFSSPFFWILGFALLLTSLVLKHLSKRNFSILWMFPILIYLTVLGSFKKSNILAYGAALAEQPLRWIAVVTLTGSFCLLIFSGMKAAPFFLTKGQREQKRWLLLVLPLMLVSLSHMGLQKERLFALGAVVACGLSFIVGFFSKKAQNIAILFWTLGILGLIGYWVFRWVNDDVHFSIFVSSFWIIFSTVSFFQIQEGWPVDIRSDAVNIQNIDRWLRSAWFAFFITVSFGAYLSWWEQGVWFGYSARETFTALIFLLLTLSLGWARWGMDSYRRGLSFLFIALWLVFQFLDRFEIGFRS